jgi:hypothetical protein
MSEAKNTAMRHERRARTRDLARRPRVAIFGQTVHGEPEHMRTGWDRGRAKGLSLFALISAIACALGTLATPAAGQATKKQPAATEVGVTPSEINIAVIADSRSGQ